MTGPQPQDDDGSRRGTRAQPRHVRGRRRGSRTARWWVLGGLGVVVLVLAAGAWLASSALRARTALESARDDITALQDRVRDGDEAGAQATIADLQAHTRTANRATHGPVWALASLVPKLGPNVDALQTVSSTVDGIAQHALPSLMAASLSVDPAHLAPVDGAIDLAPLTKVAPQVTGADQAMQAAVAQLAQIDTAQLQPQVATAVDQVRRGLDKAATTTATAAKAVALLPPMLGADGSTRNYLVLVQNNAEPRATGGIPGVVLHLQAKDGKVSAVDERSGGSLVTEKPALPLHDDEQAIFTPLLGTDMRDVTFTPDFPRSGALAKAIWEKQVGGTIDGVVSVDPGALALVLKATGPVKLPDGSTLTADDAVQRLLNQVYLDIPQPAAQDAWFAGAAASVFSAMLSGQGSGSGVVDQLAEAARQGRLMVWAAHDGEQAQLKGTVLSGELTGTTGRSGVAPGAVVGVYLNDGTAAKMGYYEDLTVTGKATTCRPDRSQLVHLDVTLTNTAPANAAATLPPYVLGPDKFVPWGSVQTNVLLYGPLGGLIETVKQDPGPQGLFAQNHDKLTVGVVTSVLAPGQSKHFSVDVVTAPGQAGDVQIRTTPTARQAGRVNVASSCLK